MFILNDIFWIDDIAGFKSRRDVPKLVQRCIDGKLPVDHFITHTLDGVDKTNDAIEALPSGHCLRAVVRY